MGEASPEKVPYRLKTMKCLSREKLHVKRKPAEKALHSHRVLATSMHSKQPHVKPTRYAESNLETAGAITGFAPRLRIRFSGTATHRAVVSALPSPQIPPCLPPQSLIEVRRSRNTAPYRGAVCSVRVGLCLQYAAEQRASLYPVATAKVVHGLRNNVEQKQNDAINHRGTAIWNYLLTFWRMQISPSRTLFSRLRLYSSLCGAPSSET
jgi:hypothetical protein